MDMKSLTKMAVAAASLIGAGLLASAPANAQVHIGIGIPGVHVGVGVGAPAFYYGPGFYPPGPCDAYNSYYAGDCGYAVYNGPIVLDGVSVVGPHYYRWYNGMPYFWYRGGWHNWNGWARVNFGWDHGEGFGWHNGHWDRNWGNAHWHGAPAAFHGDPHRGDARRDHDDRRGDPYDHH
jgi:hypothetical protein